MNLENENEVNNSYKKWLLSFQEYEKKQKSTLGFSEISEMNSLLENQKNARLLRIMLCLNDIHQKVLDKTLFSLFFNNSIISHDMSIKKIISDFLNK
jgi:hypothetical protein